MAVRAADRGTVPGKLEVTPLIVDVGVKVVKTLIKGAAERVRGNENLGEALGRKKGGNHLRQS